MDEDIPRAEMLIAEWRDAAEQAEDEQQLLSAMSAAAIMAQKKGDNDGARAEFIRIMALAAERGNRGREASAALNLGVLATLSGDCRAGLEIQPAPPSSSPSCIEKTSWRWRI
jgi:Flp pilus assembly protein TadD